MPGRDPNTDLPYEEPAVKRDAGIIDWFVPQPPERVEDIPDFLVDAAIAAIGAKVLAKVAAILKAGWLFPWHHVIPKKLFGSDEFLYQLSFEKHVLIHRILDRVFKSKGLPGLRDPLDKWMPYLQSPAGREKILEALDEVYTGLSGKDGKALVNMLDRARIYWDDLIPP